MLLIPKRQPAVILPFTKTQPRFLLVFWLLNDPEHGIEMKAIPLVLSWFDVGDPFQPILGPAWLLERLLILTDQKLVMQTAKSCPMLDSGRKRL